MQSLINLHNRMATNPWTWCILPTAATGTIMRKTPRVQVGIATDPGTRARHEDFAACLAPEPGRPSVVAVES